MPAREFILALSPVLLTCISTLFFFLCISCLIYSASYVFRVLCISLLTYSASHLFRVSCIPRLISFASNVNRQLICFMSRLRWCLNPQAVQAVSQYSNRVSSHVLNSNHASQSVMRNKDWDGRQLEKQDVYRESRHPAFCWVSKISHSWDQLYSTHSLMRFLLYLLTIMAQSMSYIDHFFTKYLITRLDIQIFSLSNGFATGRSFSLLKSLQQTAM